MIEVREYSDEAGRSPFGRWFSRLKTEAATWVLTALTRIEEDANFGDTKSVGKGVSELRINKGPGYRVYYGMDGNTLIILLAGGTKKQQQKDIDKSLEYWADYKRRKKQCP